ncbi:MAG: hypothetical protein CMH62_01835 [Nanoarchaeota archaeon]|nr:hypothetical protein [Nanoarchaeota archaeon]|tara:strand:+ start:2548 stop:2988 length:441 start_codon:yes stop_codon:yes gene_type:complete
MTVLVLKINKNRLHDEEFVRPVTDLLEDFKVVDYREVKNLDFDKVIICGTALKDNEYLDNLDKFSWLKNCKKPVLGICAGMHIIGKILGYDLIENKKIGVEDNKYYLHSFKIEGLDESLEVENFKGMLFHPEVLNKELIKDFVNLT